MADNITEGAIPSPAELSSSKWDFLKHIRNPINRARNTKGERSAIEPPAFVQEARNQLIDKILNQGLLSSETVGRQRGDYLGSIDREPMSSVFGRTIKPIDQYQNPTIFQNALDQILYTGDTSCLPVVTERPGESSEQRHLIRSTQAEKNTISQRTFSSFMVVCRANSETDYARTEDQTRPENFAYLIFPKQILQEYGADKLASMRVTIKAVDNIIKRSLCMGDQIDLPDYEEAIKEILVETQAPVWIHAVRLPLEADLIGKESQGYQTK